MWLSNICSLFPIKKYHYRRAIRKLFSIIIPNVYTLYCFFHKIKRNNVNNNIVVSLTSYPGRILHLDQTIQSLLRQTVATRVILYVAKSDFPDLKLPNKIEKLKSNGLTVKYVDQDLRSYKKFYYAAQDYSNKIIITADDDVIYPEDWVEKLYKTYLSHTDCVVCFRAHEITFNSDGSFQHYNDWNMYSIGIQGPSKLLVPTGVSGILYPPGFFRIEDLDEKKFLQLAPTADDLWLKAMELKNGYPVVKVDKFSYHWFLTKGSQRTSLQAVNTVGENLNDVALTNLDLFYGLAAMCDHR